MRRCLLSGGKGLRHCLDKDFLSKLSSFFFLTGEDEAEDGLDLIAAGCDFLPGEEDLSGIMATGKDFRL